MGGCRGEGSLLTDGRGGARRDERGLLDQGQQLSGFWLSLKANIRAVTGVTCLCQPVYQAKIPNEKNHNLYYRRVWSTNNLSQKMTTFLIREMEGSKVFGRFIRLS